MHISAAFKFLNILFFKYLKKKWGKFILLLILLLFSFAIFSGVNLFFYLFSDPKLFLFSLLERNSSTFSAKVMLGFVAGALTFIGYLPYFISILRRKTKPHRVTWWVLVLVGAMLFSSYYSLGASSTVWVSISYFFGPLIIAVAAMFYGQKGWNRIDWFCVCGIIFAIFLWLTLRDPFIVLLLNLVIDFIGLLPTIHKSYLHPHTEDRLAWLFWWIGSTLNIFAISSIDPHIAIYPIYMFFGNGLITLLVWMPHFKNYKSLSKGIIWFKSTS